MIISGKDYSKAEVLEQLRDKAGTFQVLSQIIVNQKEFTNNKIDLVGKILKKFGKDTPLAIRSSCIDEDSKGNSHAGEYKSFLNVRGRKNISNSIEQVFESYEKSNVLNQVFVQPMVISVTMSGVLFTKNPSNNGQYYVINYDDTTQNTTSVTSGGKSGSKVYRINRYFRSSDMRMSKLIDVARDLERILKNDELDIEFVVDKKGTVYILQVRSLKVADDVFDWVCKSDVLDAEEMIHKKNNESEDLGESTIYSVMTDWNPAEIIGIRPRNLAYSLYNELILKDSWAIQRANYGYRDLRGKELMIKILGIPYIDVRKSINSLIPARISDKVGKKLVNYWIDKIKFNPDLHDKLELEVVPTVYTLNFCKFSMDLIRNNVLTLEEVTLYKDYLREITIDMFKEEGNLDKDVEKIEFFSNYYHSDIVNSIETIKKSIKFVKEFGIIPFSGIARSAFSAKAMLESFVNRGAWTENDLEEFMESINTVGKCMAHDKAKLNRFNFLSKYGHLRPGTYDINVSRYDSDSRLQVERTGFNYSEYKYGKKASENDLLDKLANKIPVELTTALGISSKFLMHQIIKAIEMREFAKFEFTKWVSDSLEIIAKVFEAKGMTREEVSYLELDEIFNGKDVELMEISKKNKSIYDKYLTCNLPELITRNSDLYGFFDFNSTGNYITDKAVSGEVVLLNKNNITLSSDLNLKNKIVFLESADPGYDYIFPAGIVGLVTKYGGPNSHMAIKLSELSIPGVLGVGEEIFERFKVKRKVSLDCKQKHLW